MWTHIIRISPSPDWFDGLERLASTTVAARLNARPRAVCRCAAKFALTFGGTRQSGASQAVVMSMSAPRHCATACMEPLSVSANQHSFGPAAEHDATLGRFPVNRHRLASVGYHSGADEALPKSTT